MSGVYCSYTEGSIHHTDMVKESQCLDCSRQDCTYRRAGKSGRGNETGEYQDRAFEWARRCFGEKSVSDPVERAFRFLEESLELAQAVGCSKDDAIRLVDYVYGRKSGNIEQEVGGVFITLAVLCSSLDHLMQELGERELCRVVDKIDQIREKHVRKPNYTSSSREEKCQEKERQS